MSITTITIDAQTRERRRREGIFTGIKEHAWNHGRFRCGILLGVLERMVQAHSTPIQRMDDPGLLIYFCVPVLADDQSPDNGYTQWVSQLRTDSAT